MNVYNPDFKTRIKQHLDRQYFMKHIGFQLDVIEVGRTEGWLKLDQIHQQQKGFAHGGLVATLADITAGFAAYTLVPEGFNVVTGEIKISYLNPGVGQELRAKGWVLKQGRKMSFCESEVWCKRDDSMTLIAKATSTMVNISAEDTKR
ncbi:PaaI family thioesterase [Fulvivirga sp. M361]|uniref:PaaI family thioesterase n=1 Tax=Fulvivirga sp. M361 TaxID=2594266 RepID=UPI00117997F1|nr:PaaI family thioesterase [Fulvivirga sp. M361]TRX49838.1 PaaI family thioesterase [Fulvivirga sp. M361]